MSNIPTTRFIVLVIIIETLVGIWNSVVGNYQAATYYILFAILLTILSSRFINE